MLGISDSACFSGVYGLFYGRKAIDWTRMSVSTAIDLLKQAESALLSQISSTDASDGDYDVRFACLTYAKKVHDLTQEITDIQQQNPRESVPTQSAVALAPTSSPTAGITQDYRFPLFFIHNGKLWKIAERKDEARSRYTKSIALQNVNDICQAIHAVLASQPSFTVDGVKDQLGGGEPPYRIQLTVGALCEADCLVSAGRGKYTHMGEEKTPEEWVNALKELPEHSELLPA